MFNTRRVVGRSVACLALLLGPRFASAATLPAGFSETTVAGGLRSPTAMTFAPDGRLFVCEQAGTLRVIKNGVLLATPFVTLTVNSLGERGLLGVAFDPDFATNPFVYVYYTATTPNVHNRVSRFTADGDTALAGSEVVLMDLEPLGATNHNGGAIHFGLDGKLYVAVGENAVPSNAQSLGNRLGKILRMNADGTIPPDNPFVDVTAGPNQSIWALGLRNPFTFAFRPLTGLLLINDVGASSWEEVNVGAAGANYGWPITEGPTSDPRFVSPAYAYTHADGCAISGGAFHSPFTPQFPARYWGSYFFADFCGGWIRATQPDGTVAEFASGITRPVDLAFAADGTLHYLARGAGAATGIVSRVEYTVESPRIDVTANGGDGPLLLTKGQALDVSLSFDAGGSGSLPSTEVFFGVVTPFGLFWLDPVSGFVPGLVPVYTGPLGTFAPTTLFAFPDVASLFPGLYLWFILVDEQVDGVPRGDFSDFVLTGIS